MVIPCVPALGGETPFSIDLGERGRLNYVLITPDDHDRATPVPTLLALPPGMQNEAMVEEGLRRYWREEAQRRGWAVVSPSLPSSMARGSFGEEGRGLIPVLLAEVRRHVKVEGDTFHLAGVSNGGKSAFSIALAYPDLFASILVLPGYPAVEGDMDRLGALRGKPMRMYTGELDARWRGPSEAAASALEKAGALVEHTIVKGQGHVLELTPAMLFDVLDQARPRGAGDTVPSMKEGSNPGSVAASALPADQAQSLAEIARVLDALHEAASKADGVRYFSLFTNDAVFLGTDAAERWTIGEFRDYAMKRFATGVGWTYRVTERHIALGPSGDAAWFDERLMNEKYGECRGTGALVKRGDSWRIAQYNLLVPIPNDLLPRVAELIREHLGPGKAGPKGE